MNGRVLLDCIEVCLWDGPLCLRASVVAFNNESTMRILEVIIDIALFLFEKLKELVLFLLELIISLMKKLYEKFDEVSVPEKAIFLNTALAFLAVVLPVASFRIPAFGSDYYVNNPLAVYLIGITIFMFASLYFSWRYIPAARVLLNAYYLFWVIYIPLADGFTRAQPHSISFGFYLNIIVPVIYIVASGLHWMGER